METNTSKNSSLEWKVTQEVRGQDAIQIPIDAEDIIICSTYITDDSLYSSYAYVPNILMASEKYVYGSGGKSSSINESCIVRWRITKTYVQLIVSESQDGSKTMDTYTTVYYR